jgi:23S rRNA pseudouridine1911/1915/1917 synthase
MIRNGSDPSGRRTLIVEEPDAGERLDRFLARHLSDFSRGRLQVLIRAGAVTRTGAAVHQLGARVKTGETYEIVLPAPQATQLEAEPRELAIVYEDADLIVIDKPKGLAVHPGAGRASGTLVNALLAHCGDSLSGIGGVKRPGIVHRLDKDTTGLLVVAKTDAAHRGLAEQFATHGADGCLERGYRALVWGVPERPRGVIDAPLGRSRTNRTKVAVVAASAGRRAVTRYEVLQVFRARDGKPVASFLRLTLETGRTHQVRVHLAHIGHPVLGDPTYGSGFKASACKLTPAAQAALVALDRQALHAAELAFEHPISGQRLRFVSPLPADMATVLAALTMASPDARGDTRQRILDARPRNTRRR